MVKFPVGKAGWNAPNKTDYPGDGSWSRFEVWSHDLEPIILETMQNYCESTFLTKNYNVGSQFQVNKMKPTNPNAHTYVNGADVKTHGYAVTHNTFLQ